MRVTGHALDLGVIIAYLIGITWFGTRFKEKQKSLKGYFLGGAMLRGGPLGSPLSRLKPAR